MIGPLLFGWNIKELENSVESVPFYRRAIRRKKQSLILTREKQKQENTRR
jgi:hypothetical protein